MENDDSIGKISAAQPLPALSKPVLWGLVAAKLLLHLPGLFRYGYFRDELYFLDCARHLDWGYVDCAPLVAVYAKIALALGGSLPTLRILPARSFSPRCAGSSRGPGFGSAPRWRWRSSCQTSSGNGSTIFHPQSARIRHTRCGDPEISRATS